MARRGNRLTARAVAGIGLGMILAACASAGPNSATPTSQPQRPAAANHAAPFADGTEVLGTQLDRRGPITVTPEEYDSFLEMA
ncbi:MAG: hypothetical protein JJE46_04270, partial [Acidimicrobiia bacterium]|nr:hypothetical protein [Acidimicrobiia bacterium]